MKSFAAACAAASRLGSTSPARMLSDTSMVRMIVRCCEGSVISAVGRAAASAAMASAVKKSTGGMCLRQLARGMPGIAFGRRA